jgi:hypothetical protein
MRWKHRNSDFFTVLPHHFAGSNAFAHEHQGRRFPGRRFGIANLMIFFAAQIRMYEQNEAMFP